MRTFIAVPIDEPIRDALVRMIDRLRTVGADVKWVERQNLHLTLRFLGEIDEAPAETLRGLLRTEAERFTPMAIELRGLGQFPPRAAPRVVWAGCIGDVPKLAGLASAVDRAAKAIGVPPEERPFSAHLTIGRVKSPKNGRALADQLAAKEADPFGKQTVDRFVLYKSTLTPAGPIYEAIETYPLKA